MTKETKHLIFWWFEWLERLIRTTYHIFNRESYRKWKKSRDINNKFYFGYDYEFESEDGEFDLGEEEH